MSQNIDSKPEKSTSTKSSNAVREEAILKFWQENKIFEKSLKKEAPKGKYIFYDGPPFATGLPHYGHILGSTVKDVFGRYKTMRGYNVPRRWGWDCHGLPIENIVEKELGISGKKAIEELGIDKFTSHARSKVLTYVNEWKKTVDRMGRWVDFDNSYKTMDNTFIESVWWALGEMDKKGLLYEGVRVLAYCPRCETPIANSEIAMDNSYKDITDISVYVKFKLYPGQKYGEGKETKDSAYLLAWTTTPWTLPGNTAIAINKDIIYSAIRVKGIPELLIVANETIKNVFKNQEIEIVHDDIKGHDLIGLSYEPLFSYYKNSEEAKNKNIWKVWHADFVTLDKGSGIAHEAPAFGEDDMNLARAHNIPFIRHVEPNGTFSKEVTDFAGIKVKPVEDNQSTDVLIIKYLAKEGKLFSKEKIIHSYPHCYRCETPLLYYALPSWFVNIQKVKNDLLKKAEFMNWIPSHLKEGRFKNTMESAPDWTISRNRYWASPLPIWKSDSGKVLMINSLEDLKLKTKKSGNRYFVVRHGEAEHNISNSFNAEIKTKPHLTDNGRKQVGQSIKNFEKINFDFIYSSPFVRAKETAEIIKKEINFTNEIIFDDRLRELNSGDYEGKTVNSCPERYSVGEIERLSLKFPNGESQIDVRKRVGSFLSEMESRYQNKNILISTHGDVIWMSQAICQAMSPEETISLKKNYPQNGEIRELNFMLLPHNENYELDLHRPYIDKITLIDSENREYKRIPEVIDCWFESGSMPFAQDHFPFENQKWQKENFPAGFVAEYIAQTRTWFYYTHTISSILFNHAPFENVVTTGTVLAEDGSKMSKSKNNYPDPWLLFNKYGVDALRFYLISSPLMKGEDVNFSEKLVQETSSKIINRLDNVTAFYELYRDSSIENMAYNPDSNTNILDKWIISRLKQMIVESTNGMEKYDLVMATRPLEPFIEDLSTWYLRRSRERLKGGDIKAKQTLYYILKTFVKILAPLAPFTAEDIWQKLKTKDDEESVHLAKWPEYQNRSFVFKFILKKIRKDGDDQAIEEMKKARELVTLGLQARQKAGIPVRQPLNQLRIKNLKLRIEYKDIIRDEMNVKEVKSEEGQNLDVELDTNITPELKEEGKYRELIRVTQDFRKISGLTPSDIVTFGIDTDEEGQKFVDKFKDNLLKAVGAKGIEFEKVEGPELRIDNFVFKLKVER